MEIAPVPDLKMALFLGAVLIALPACAAVQPTDGAGVEGDSTTAQSAAVQPTDGAGIEGDSTTAQTVVGCPLTPNAKESYDLANGEGSFRCHLACGKGCLGCEVTVGEECGDPGQSGRLHTFKCYKRPCCVTHDACLSDAANGMARLTCHLQASQDGCAMTDARGETSGGADATCFNPPPQCLAVSEPVTAIDPDQR